MTPSKDIFKHLNNYFLYQNKLKNVYRHTRTEPERRESSAEHSWSAATMAWILTPYIEEEFNTKLDQLKIIKMALIHDIVEIDAGDVAAWNASAREDIVTDEHQAILALKARYQAPFSEEIYTLWMEHDALETLESKLVKGCDQLCPVIERVALNCDYKGTGVDREKLDNLVGKKVAFSQVLSHIYTHFADEMGSIGLFDNQ